MAGTATTDNKGLYTDKSSVTYNRREDHLTMNETRPKCVYISHICIVEIPHTTQTIKLMTYDDTLYILIPPNYNRLVYIQLLQRSY